MGRPHGYCRTCRAEVWAVPVTINGHQHWTCEKCSDCLMDVSWEAHDAPTHTAPPQKGRA